MLRSMIGLYPMKSKKQTLAVFGPGSLTENIYQFRRNYHQSCSMDEVYNRDHTVIDYLESYDDGDIPASR